METYDAPRLDLLGPLLQDACEEHFHPFSSQVQPSSPPTSRPQSCRQPLPESPAALHLVAAPAALRAIPEAALHDAALEAAPEAMQAIPEAALHLEAAPAALHAAAMRGMERRMPEDLCNKI